MFSLKYLRIRVPSLHSLNKEICLFISEAEYDRDKFMAVSRMNYSSSIHIYKETRQLYNQFQESVELFQKSRIKIYLSILSLFGLNWRPISFLEFFLEYWAKNGKYNFLLNTDWPSNYLLKFVFTYPWFFSHFDHVSNFYVPYETNRTGCSGRVVQGTISYSSRENALGPRFKSHSRLVYDIAAIIISE